MTKIFRVAEPYENDGNSADEADGGFSQLTASIPFFRTKRALLTIY